MGIEGNLFRKNFLAPQEMANRKCPKAGRPIFGNIQRGRRAGSLKGGAVVRNSREFHTAVTAR
jgi:hypothetical protein